MDAEAEFGQRWAAWLRERLGSRPQKYLVDRSDGAIKPDRVSRWLRGQRPDPEGAAAVADIFGIDRAEVLHLVGYDNLVPLSHEQLQRIEPPTPAATVDPMEAEIDSLELSDRAKEIIRERRAQNLRDLRALITILRETEQPKDPANRAGGHGSD